jgi:hypothetical protein
MFDEIQLGNDKVLWHRAGPGRHIAKRSYFLRTPGRTWEVVAEIQKRAVLRANATTGWHAAILDDYGQRFEAEGTVLSFRDAQTHVEEWLLSKLAALHEARRRVALCHGDPPFTVYGTPPDFTPKAPAAEPAALVGAL